MLSLDGSDLSRLLDRASLIEALAAMFRDGCEAPVRHHHTMAVTGAADATLLLMPAWVPGRYAGTKIVTVFPDNGRKSLPSVHSLYLLFSGQTGELLATCDGAELTVRRTVAASSLAARHLARADASRLLVVGTGAVAGQIAASHAAVRPIRDIAVWGRDAGKAEALAIRLGRDGFRAHRVDDLAEAAGWADIISCATLAREPVIRGEWLRPGQHLDLIGGFTPHMREADDEVVRRAAIFVDTAGALSEGGDIVVPLASGVLPRDRILADLADLAAGRHSGRRSDGEITLFKSVGAAAEDLAAGILAYERAAGAAAHSSGEPPR